MINKYLIKTAAILFLGVIVSCAMGSTNEIIQMLGFAKAGTLIQFAFSIF